MNYPGMWADGDPSLNPPYSSRKNKNVVLRNGTVLSEPGFTRSYTVPLDTILGKVPVNNGDFVLFGTTETSYGTASRILLCEKEGFKYVASEYNYSGVLAFNKNRWITGVFVVNHLNERIVVFVDGDRPIGMANLDNPIKPENVGRYSYYFFPTYEPATVTVKAETGGALLAGGYIPFYQLEGFNGETSRYFLLPGVNLGNGRYGIKEGGISSQQITYNAINLKAYKINFGFIRKVNGVVTAWQATGIYANNNRATMNITTMDSLTELTLDEVLVQTATFRAGTVGLGKDELLFSGIKEPVKLDLQEYVDEINLQWTSRRYSIHPGNTDFGAGRDIYDQTRSFAKNEVYAFYWRRLYVDREGDWYLIPGREGTEQERENVNTGLGDDPSTTNRLRRFQVYSTAGSNGIDKFTGIATGAFGFWENQNEFYDSGKYQGQRVRHFRFPSYTLLRSLYGNKYMVDFADKLGVKLSFTKPLPEEPGVIGWELGFAKRTYGNSTVVGPTPIVTMQRTVEQNTSGYYKEYETSSGFNYANFPGPNYSMPKHTVFGSDNTQGGRAELVYRTYNFEMLKDNLYVPNMYLKFDYTLKNRGFIQANAGEGGEFRTANVFLTPTESLLEAENNFRVTKQMIIGNNSAQPKGDSANRVVIDNLLLEKFIYVETVADFSVVYAQNTVGVGAMADDVTPMATVMMYKEDCYLGYRGQSVAVAGANTNDNIIWGGDVLPAYTSINQHGRWEYAPDIVKASLGDDDKDMTKLLITGPRVMRSFITESVYDLNRRVYELADETMKFMPAFTTFKLNRDVEPNNLSDSINEDYLFLNTLEDRVIYNAAKPQVTNFPFRIYKGPKQVRESDKYGWYKFRANNYYEMPKDRGEVIAIVPKDGYMFIVCRYATFRTQSNIQLETTNGVSVNTGKGDIFAQDPIEVMHTEFGRIGARAIDCVKDTSFGLVVIDQDLKRIYLINQGVQEISGAGHELFFNDNLETIANYPYIGSGFEIAEDFFHKRLLITRKHKLPERFVGVYEEGMILNDGDVVLKDGKMQEYYTEETTVVNPLLIQ